MPFFFLFKQKTAYEMRISDWSSDVCSSDLYDVQEIEQFRVLRGLAYHAVRQQDPRLIGRVATASARISQHHLAKPRFEAVVGLAEAPGACGVQAAQLGRAACGEGVGQDVLLPGVAVTLKKKQHKKNI